MVETGEYRLGTDCYRYHGHLLQCTLVTRDTGDTEHVNTLYHTKLALYFVYQATRNDIVNFLLQMFHRVRCNLRL